MLRFLIASREEVAASQLRDDLLSMLVAGHETTGSVLTWTLHLLATHPEQMAKVGITPLAVAHGLHVSPQLVRLLPLKLVWQQVLVVCLHCHLNPARATAREQALCLACQLVM